MTDWNARRIDIPLDLDPREITIFTKPGSRSYEDLKIHNAADEPIEIIPTLVMPEYFKQTVNNVLLQNLSAVDWLSIQPETLELDSYDTRNLRITARMPEDALRFSSYYSLLELKVVYPNGETAGTLPVKICVSNENASSEPEVTCTGVELIEQNVETGEYLVNAEFLNNSPVHINPEKSRAVIAYDDGYARTGALMTSPDSGMLLPYKGRIYTGTIDISSLDPGAYALEVMMLYTPERRITKQIAIRIIEEDNHKIPIVTDLNVKSENLTKVTW